MTGTDVTATRGETAALDAVLRCWVTENGIPLPDTGSVSIPVPGGEVRASVTYRSATGHHRFADVGVGPVDLARTLGGDTLAGLVADSVSRISRYLAARSAETVAPHGDPFLSAEQDLLLGHLTHPAAKSRDGISDDEDQRYAPELRGSFPLHWFAVDAGLVRAGCAEHPVLGDALATLGAGPAAAAGRVLVPAHPWQAGDLVRRNGFRELVDAGRITPLGPDGPAWYPTSSLRTVYRPGDPVMLKLSLGLRITNSRRENTLTELARGIEVCRLLDAGIADTVREAYPGFRIVADPAYLAAVFPDGSPTHLDVSVREAPAGITGARCLAGFVAPQPGIRPAAIVTTVRELASRLGRPVESVAAEWVRRYVDRVLAPMVHLYATTGIGLEAHQQNTLVILDADGWPETGWYRDNQGYYLASSALPTVLSHLDGATSSTLAVAQDSTVDDRLTYYLLLNQALAPVAALGGADVAAEEDLLGAVRDGLAALVDRGHDTTGGLVRRWLTADTLPRKANLATRVAGIDEVLAPVDNQSVYHRTPNPLRETR
ncbi:MAG TPA: IucA/IucC family protein [Actinocatenispora sp.]